MTESADTIPEPRPVLMRPDCTFSEADLGIGLGGITGHSTSARESLQNMKRILEDCPLKAFQALKNSPQTQENMRPLPMDRDIYIPTNHPVDEGKMERLTTLLREEQEHANKMAPLVKYGQGDKGYNGLSSEQMENLGRCALREKISNETEERADFMRLVPRHARGTGMRAIIMPYLSRFVDKLPLNEVELSWLALLLDLPVEKVQELLTEEYDKKKNQRRLEATMALSGGPGAMLLFKEVQENRKNWRSHSE
ncbi:MAG: hypothetical protein Q9162_003287 [Coniocarpon cinnabarinum]